MTNLKLVDGTYSTNTQESIVQMLNTLIPLEQENAQGDELVHEIQYHADPQEDFSMLELKGSIKKAKPRISP